MIEVDFITNRVFNSRTYILSCQRSDLVWLVDCGDMDRVLKRIGAKKVEGVLLTHTHSDHIYGLGMLLERFPEATIYTNAFGSEALRSPRLNISRYHSEYPDISIDAPSNIVLLEENASISVFDVPVRVFETPGHDPSCLTYMIEDKFFTGDAYIPGVKVFTGFRRSSRKQAEQSVDRISALSSGYQIMPGHTILE